MEAMVLRRTDSMREIVFDTETTGLDPKLDRVIEFGGIELVNRFPTGRSIHYFFNPQGREIHPDALAVHGIGAQDLADKPSFAEMAEYIAAFFEGARLVAHNAGFDLGFVNAEFQRLGMKALDPTLIVDTLALARRKHPMGPNSLDALCRRYGIDNSRRTKHGALLDSELLAEVYVELIGGKQAALLLEVAAEQTATIDIGGMEIAPISRPAPLPPRLSEAELAAHAMLVAEIGEKAIWIRVQ
jgi:DNA polymerase III subunit epsilon